MNLIKNNKTNKAVFSVVLSIVLVASGYLVYAKTTNSSWPFREEATVEVEESTKGVNEVDYGPPSSEDIDSSQDAKDRLDSSNSQGAGVTNSPTKSNAHIGISMVDIVNGSVEVRAFISGVIEGDGQCKVRLAKNDLIVSVSSTAFIDSTTTICTPTTIPLSSFKESGDWYLTVNYVSSSSNNTSAPQKVVIP